ncbi:MAG: PKD domain-containing protein [Planctomycetes bacterium]|nr:PKD domain-containing protein [Planctomycetota bacterium]
MLHTAVLFVAIALSGHASTQDVNARSTATSTNAAPSTELTHFIERRGVQELTGRLIARPRQPRAFLDRGESLEAAWAHHANARKVLSRFRLVRYVPETDESIVELAERGSEERVAAAWMATGDFEYVEPDWLLFPDSSVLVHPAQQANVAPAPPLVRHAPLNCPSDLYFPSQWHLQSSQLMTCEAWSLETGSPSISVGICDTGLRSSHEDFQLHRLEGYNAVDHMWESQGGQTGPAYNHGTRTTGVTAANGNNALGTSGVGWNLSFRMVRVSNASNGGAYLSDLQHGARTSIESGDRVANVSYAGVSSTSNLTTASYIRALGGLLVWAAGNEGSALDFSHRDADDLLVVGASDMGSGLAYFSNYGSYVDLVAPGVNVFTTDSFADNAYTSSASGTSFAAPIVTGVCAMLWSARPGLSPDDVERLVKRGATDLGAAGIDDTFGYGRANLFDTLSLDGTATPHARLAGIPASGTSPLVVKFRDLSTGVPTSWLWSFGDGSTSTQQNPTHTYTTSGTYSVSLQVANSRGTDQVTQTNYVLVDVIPPIADFSASVTNGLSPLSVNFHDQSTGGIPTSWAWDFGDGTTSTLQHPTHVYTTSGSFTVALVASNAYGTDMLTKYSLITADYIPPVAAFSAQPTTGNSPYVVNFTDQSTGGVASSWTWYFGDGGAAVVKNPQHTYTVPGDYTVRLIAANAYGSSTLDRVSYIHVGPGPSILANFTATPLSGNAPLQVAFTDLSVGNIVQWEWDFGDDTNSTLPNPVHVYTTPGEYDVSLQVTNANGSDSQENRSKYIIVH